MKKKKKITLVPIEFFGAESYGNRAVGHLYRLDDNGDRIPGDSVDVWIDLKDPELFKKKFGDK